jgi:Asp-tRNA(Asn)/Glu-tRNA(Gln) amidotransferase A subunit family amidase
MPTSIHQRSATETLASFRSREVSPVEVMEALIDRAAEGLPVAIKEEMPVAGQPHTHASLVFAERVATVTAPLAQRMIDAGAIVHARTTCPEFSTTGFTQSRLFGVTRNPWNLAYDVGGSSGGSAASLAAGTTMLASGSDIGGSIRIPASCCGVVGFKPPYGRVPQLPPACLDHFAHEGPLARTVADARLFQNLIAGPHPHDAASLRPTLKIPEPRGDMAGWKFALSLDLGDYRLDPDVRTNTLAAAEAFREAGATVEEIDLPWTREMTGKAVRAHFSLVFGAWVREISREHADLMTPYARDFAKEMGRIDISPYEGLQIEAEIHAVLGELHERYDLLICPAVAVPAVEAGNDYRASGILIDSVESDLNRDCFLTTAFNVCSRNPVMSVPSGLSRDGVPTGLQIVGRTYDDASVFEAAAAFERLRPWGMATAV